MKKKIPIIDFNSNPFLEALTNAKDGYCKRLISISNNPKFLRKLLKQLRYRSEPVYDLSAGYREFLMSAGATIMKKNG